MAGLGEKLIAQEKCIHASAHSMGEKQEEQEACVQQESCDRVSIAETWGGDSGDWSEGKAECLWVRLRGKANQAGLLVRVCYRPPNQHEEADEEFYKLTFH